MNLAAHRIITTALTIILMVPGTLKAAMIDTRVLWRDPLNIPVCWHSSTRNYPELRRLMREFIDAEFGRAGLRFRYHETCWYGQSAIRLALEEKYNKHAGGHSPIGRYGLFQWDKRTLINVHWLNRFRSLAPNEVELRKKLFALFISCAVHRQASACSAQKKLHRQKLTYTKWGQSKKIYAFHYTHSLKSFAAVVLHEVGHILGMHHEHTRPVALANPKNKKCASTRLRIRGADWQYLLQHPERLEDRLSIMTYCRETNQPRPSRYDVEALRIAYFGSLNHSE